MPKQVIENMNHGAATDHRILRDPSEDVLAIDQVSQQPSDELVYDSRPLGFEHATPDLRSLALAYPQVAGHYPELRQKGLAVLQQAAREFPDDADVQGTYGQVLSVVQPGKEAADALQRAIDLGSKSPEVRTKLADLMLQQGNATAAIDLYKQSIQIEPFYTQAYLDLARAYLMLEDPKNARSILDRVLKFDPGNEAAHRALKLATPTDNKPSLLR